MEIINYLLVPLGTLCVCYTDIAFVVCVLALTHAGLFGVVVGMRAQFVHPNFVLNHFVFFNTLCLLCFYQLIMSKLYIYLLNCSS